MGCGPPPPPPRPPYCYPYVPPPKPYVPPPPPPPPPPVLTECKVDVSIVDVYSWVTLSQKFHNPGSSTANQIIYNFSVLAGSAICSFVMTRADGSRVGGVVKEREQAKRELDSALKAGKLAALGQEVTKDVFSISVGNIQPKETITIDVGYMSPLIDDENRYFDDNDGRNKTKAMLRFTLPRTYLQRFGTAPTGVSDAKVSKYEDIPFSMNVTIQQASRIRWVKTLQGPVTETSLWQKPPGTPRGISEQNFAQIKLASAAKTSDTSDIIIVIFAEQLNDDRAFIEYHPTDRRSVAVALSLAPRHSVGNSASSPGMEFICLMDRSTSMDGIKLSMTQAAISQLIKQLPRYNTTFNIISFGTKVSYLWPKSQPYTAVTESQAIQHVSTMQADHGGTDTAAGLEAAFSTLATTLDRPAAIFVITDGGQWDVQSCVSKVENAMKTRPTANNYLRIFTVGIGSGVSTEMCDTIAKVGNGASLYIVSPTEEVVGKCIRLVLAARSPPVTNIRVDWLAEEGGDFQTFQQQPPPRPPPTNFDNDDLDDPDDVGSVVSPWQAPVKVETYFSNTRKELFAILPIQKITQSSHVELTGTFTTTGESFKRRIALQEMAPLGKFPRLHTLAAKAIIDERELGRSENPNATAETLKGDIVYLGLTYGLTSRHTSYLAIANGDVIGVGDNANADGLPHGRFVEVPQPRTNYTNSSSGASQGFAAVSFIHAQGAQTRAFSAPSAPQMDPDQLWEILIQMQTFEGDFAARSGEVIQLLAGQGGAPALEAFAQFGVMDEKVVAAVLAWAWMRACCGTKVLGTVEKIDVWVRENVPNTIDVDKLESRVEELHTFEG